MNFLKKSSHELFLFVLSVFNDMIFCHIYEFEFVKG